MYDNPWAQATISIEDAWAFSIPLQSNYETMAKFHAWLPPRSQFKQSPWWAYWFARHVIRHQWLAGEALIHTDPEAWQRYSIYVQHLKWLIPELKPGTTTYNRANERRHRLIDKLVDAELTPEEQGEFEILQDQILESTARAHPERLRLAEELADRLAAERRQSIDPDPIP